MIHKYLSRKSFQKVMNGLFNGKLIYGISVWGSVWNLPGVLDIERRYSPALSKDDHNKLQILQNKVFRLATGLSITQGDSSDQTSDGLWQLSVQQKSAYHSILQVYKTLSTKELEYIFSKSVPEDETDNNKHTINTRRKQLEIIRIDNKLAVSRTSFFYRVSKLWNDLPLSTRKRKKLGSFKTKVKAQAESCI